MAIPLQRVNFNWWKSQLPAAQAIRDRLMQVWTGQTQPWDLPEGRALEGQMRKGLSLLSQQLASTGPRAGYTGDMLRTAVQRAQEGLLGSLASGYNQMRSQYDPRSWVAQQQEFGIQAPLAMAQVAQAQWQQRMIEDMMNSSGFDLGGLLGGIGSLAGSILGKGGLPGLLGGFAGNGASGLLSGLSGLGSLGHFAILPSSMSVLPMFMR